jgi:chaperone modulatory protein CbpM
MEENIVRIYEGQLLEEENNITLMQLCSYCRLTPEEIIEMVEEGILEPSGISKTEWRFTFTTVERVRKAHRLINDLEINLAGAALVVHLLDRIEELEAAVRNYQAFKTY